MKSKVICSALTMAMLLMAGLCGFSQSNQSIEVPEAEAHAKPLLLERNEGELRTRRIHTDSTAPASSQFMLKVSPKNNGSQHLVAGTEDLAPGAVISKHRHLVQDEIVLIHSGKAHVSLGDQEHDLHAEYLDKFEEYWLRTHPPDLHLLSARIRGYDALQFRVGR